MVNFDLRRSSIIFLFPVTQPMFLFSKNPHIFYKGGQKNYQKSNYWNPLFCRYVILTHSIHKMAVADEHDHKHLLSQRIFFTFISTKSCELARRRLLSEIRGVNRVNKKKACFQYFPAYFY